MIFKREKQLPNWVKASLVGALGSPLNANENRHQVAHAIKEAMNIMSGSGGGQATSAMGRVSPAWMGAGNPNNTAYEYHRRLAFDLGVPEYDTMPFDHLTVVHEPGSLVTVFSMQKGQPIVFQEDAVGFPTKEFIAKLTLLKK